jgi:hypothetical protein
MIKYTYIIQVHTVSIVLSAVFKHLLFIEKHIYIYLKKSFPLTLIALSEINIEILVITTESSTGVTKHDQYGMKSQIHNTSEYS